MTDDELRAGLARGSARWSKHALEEARDDDVTSEAADAALAVGARIIRRYPEDPRGESCLALTWLADGRPIHAVIGYGQWPWVVVTVYVPKLEQWLPGFTERRR